MFSLYEAFAASASRHPDALALDLDGCRLTYDELRRSSDRLAGAIQDAVGAPRRVGLLASRSPLAYVGYLAALRLAATVVPMNPAFPSTRNQTVAESAGVDIVLHDEAISGQPWRQPVARLELPGHEVLALPERTLERTPEPRKAMLDDFAYIMFTSGSTGQPKGVPIQHRNVLAYLAYVVDRYELGPGCRLSNTFDLTFDPSVFDVFAAWSSGATVVPPRTDDLLSPVDYVNGRALTHWYSVPTVVSFARRLGSLSPGSMPSLRWSLFLGEPLTLEQARAWRRATPHGIMENTYGPTETTISCTDYRFPADPADWPVSSNGTVPIGRPYPHMPSMVVDEAGRPADEGELYFRGTQRFPGYLDPQHDPGRFGTFDGMLMRPYDGSEPLTSVHWYGTGDRVRMEGGQLVHLGRIDNQIKIRGYRVEPAEIEGALRRHPAVLDAVVIAITSADGEKELAAAYTGSRVSEAELVTTVRDRLPHYMVPRHFTCLEELPRNANGKTDRLALAAHLRGADDPASA